MVSPRDSTGVRLRGRAEMAAYELAASACASPGATVGLRAAFASRRNLSIDRPEPSARDFSLPFPPIYMHFLCRSRHDPEPGGRTQFRPWVRFPC